MDLIKDNWNENDKEKFLEYLISLKRPEKIEWTKRIINTNMELLAIPVPVLKDIAKEILKGNYKSFLDLNINDYYDNTIINGYIICKIKDFDVMKDYLDNFVEIIDNWSSCDTLAFNVNKYENEYFKLAKEYVKSDKPFKRRVGIVILFKFIKNDDYIQDIFKILDGFYNENHYYVNMVIAWILCDCFIYRRDLTLKYLENHHLNKFTVNKFISKCKDSFRISKEDKDMLLKYKVL